MTGTNNAPDPNGPKKDAGAVDLTDAAIPPAPCYSPRGTEIDIPGAPNLRGYISLPTKSSPNYAQDAKYPALMILGGSEGGIWKWLIDAWANRGYVALGVAYHKGYNEPGAELTTEQALHKEGLVLDGWSKVPDALHNIEISAFEKARARLMSHEAVANNYKPALIGTSRGGELALLLGTTYPEAFRAIVALVPCGTVQRGSSWNPSYKDRANIKAWTLDGKDPPPIDVTKISKEVPIIAASGGKDTMWYALEGPTSDSINAEKILAKRSHPGNVALHLPYAGHSLFDPKDNPGLDPFIEKLKTFRLLNFPPGPITETPDPN